MADDSSAGQKQYDPAGMPARDAYRLLLHCVAPRPIAFVSTESALGEPNLAPFSFFMAGGGNPPSVVVSPLTTRAGALKHTLVNIQNTGEFTVNVVTRAMAERMNVASADYPTGVSEWEMAGFAPAPALRVRPSRVAESPLALECRMYSIVRHGRGFLAANYVIGEVVYFHVAERVLGPDGVVDPTRIGYIARMGDDWYDHADAGSMFQMPRPLRPP